MSKPLLVADLFCGAGGSSTGAEKAIRSLGRQMTLVCINHWPVAIETHKRNHPTAQHYVEDVSVADPYKIVPGGYLDLMMASPECRFYSRARGGRPVHDQSRMNPWAIHKWLTALNVRCLLVENVSEFVNWGPLLKNGRPDPSHKGEYFQSWFLALLKMGYQAEWHYLNAADYGDATTRTRFFLIARRDGQPIIWPEPTHSPESTTTMLSQLPQWRAARDIIDWDNLGRSLLDDTKYQRRPLAETTRRRIARGLQKFGGVLAPLYIRLLGFGADNTPGDGNGQPFVMGKQGHSPAYKGSDQPIPTLTTIGKPVLVQATAEPFVLGQQSKSAPRNVADPIPTVASRGAISFINPLMVKYYGTGICHSVEEPVPTATTKGRIGLANPVLVDINHKGEGNRARPVDKPIGTVTSKRGTSLITPFMVQWDQTGGNGQYIRSIKYPVPTIVTKQNTGIVESLAVGLVEPILKRIEAGEVDPRRVVIIDGEPYLLDIRFRMLTNLELARAMGFTDQETTYEFAGNVSEVTRQIGNAVPVNMAAALVKSIFTKEASHAVSQ